MFQNITQIVKTSYSFHDSKQNYLAIELSCNKKNISALLRGITSKNNGDIYCLNYLHSFRKKAYLNSIKKYVKIKIFVMLLCLLKTLKC